MPLLFRSTQDLRLAGAVGASEGRRPEWTSTVHLLGQRAFA